MVDFRAWRKASQRGQYQSAKGKGMEKGIDTAYEGGYREGFTGQSKLLGEYSSRSIVPSPSASREPSPNRFMRDAHRLGS